MVSQSHFGLLSWKPRLFEISLTHQDYWTAVTCMNAQECCNFHGTVQCYRLMLCLAVTLYSNFLHLVTSPWTALQANLFTLLRWSAALNIWYFRKWHINKTFVTISQPFTVRNVSMAACLWHTRTIWQFITALYQNLDKWMFLPQNGNNFQFSQFVTIQKCHIHNSCSLDIIWPITKINVLDKNVVKCRCLNFTLSAIPLG